MSEFAYHHRFEPAPPGTPPGPPLLLLHGTGGDENDLIPLAQRLAPGSALLSPRGDVVERGARRFFARLAEGVFDPSEVRTRAGTLAAFIREASDRYGFDPSRLIAVGLSNGANIAAALLQLHPDTLGGAVLLRPMVVLDQTAAPGSLAGKRVLITSGRTDPIVPSDHPPRLAALLRAGGADVGVQFFQAGHNLTSDDLTVAQRFLRLEK